jgi:hypothetical protein
MVSPGLFFLTIVLFLWQRKFTAATFDPKFLYFVKFSNKLFFSVPLNSQIHQLILVRLGSLGYL